MSQPVRSLFTLRPLNTPERQLRSLACSKEADIACERTVERIREKFHFDLRRMSPLKRTTHSAVETAASSETVQPAWDWSVLSSRHQYVPAFYHQISVPPRQPSSDALPTPRLVELHRKQPTGCSPHQKVEKHARTPLGRSRSTSLPSYQFRVRKTSFTEKKRETWSKGGPCDGKELACTTVTGKPLRSQLQRRCGSRLRAVDPASKENIPVHVGTSRRRSSLLPRQEHPQTIDTYFRRILPYPSS